MAYGSVRGLDAWDSGGRFRVVGHPQTKSLLSGLVGHCLLAGPRSLQPASCFGTSAQSPDQNLKPQA